MQEEPKRCESYTRRVTKQSKRGHRKKEGPPPTTHPLEVEQVSAPNGASTRVLFYHRFSSGGFRQSKIENISKLGCPRQKGVRSTGWNLTFWKAVRQKKKGGNWGSGITPVTDHKRTRPPS